jgi:hypothetical protein
VELGVDQVRTLVVAYSGRYEFTEERTRRRSPSGTWSCEEKEVRGFARMSETHEKCCGFFAGYSKGRGPLRKMANAGSRGRGFPLPVWAGFPFFFLFFFLPSLDIYRKF